MKRQSQERLCTPDFLLIWLASLTFFGSLFLLTPTLPIYIIHLGGRASDVGLLTGIFTLTAVASRPFVGREVDRRRSKPFLVLGAFVFALASAVYNRVRSVSALLWLRAFHGLGISCFTTASTTLVANLAPPRRRGEAMGAFGTASNVALTLGPALGMRLLRDWGFAGLFLASAALGALALSLGMPVREPRQLSSLKAADGGLISRGALFPASIVFALTITYGAVLAFLPILAQRRGIHGFEFFFTLYAVILILSRTITGRFSDRYGRGAVILPGLTMVAGAMALLAVARSLALLLAGASLYGLGFGAVHPALLAFTVDRVPPRARGAAMATFGLAFDLGIGLGATVLGYLLPWTGLAGLYAIAAGMALMGMALFAVGVRR